MERLANPEGARNVLRLSLCRPSICLDRDGRNPHRPVDCFDADKC